jgi:hypothetical protein
LGELAPVITSQRVGAKRRPSLRAKRSNPDRPRSKQDWIASSQELLAMTGITGCVICGKPMDNSVQQAVHSWWKIRGSSVQKQSISGVKPAE